MTPEQYRNKLEKMDQEQLHMEFCERIGDELHEFFSVWYHSGRQIVIDYLVDHYEVSHFNRMSCIRSVLIAIFILFSVNAYADFIPDTPAKQDKLANAIYKAEGGDNAQYPFGIRSVKCDGYKDCRQICLNTIRNNIKRWTDSGRKESYLQFLANKFAPIGAENDRKQNLNQYWLKNVRWFIGDM